MASDSDDSRSFGFLLAQLRRERSLSQLALALDAGVSARHVSFLESGRSTPSRIMVTRLAEAVGASLDTRNRLLLAAGYAPAATPLAGLRTGAGGLAAQLRNTIELALEVQSMTLEEAVARSRAALSDVGFRWFHAGVVTRGKSPDSGPAK